MALGKWWWWVGGGDGFSLVFRFRPLIELKNSKKIGVTTFPPKKSNQFLYQARISFLSSTFLGVKHIWDKKNDWVKQFVGINMSGLKDFRGKKMLG